MRNSPKPPYGSRFFSCANLSFGGKNGMGSRGANNANRFGGKNCVIEIIKSRKYQKHTQNNVISIFSFKLLLLFSFFFLLLNKEKKQKKKQKTMIFFFVSFKLSFSIHRQYDHVGQLFLYVDHEHVSSNNDEDHDGHESFSYVLNRHESSYQDCSM